MVKGQGRSEDRPPPTPRVRGQPGEREAGPAPGASRGASSVARAHREDAPRGLALARITVSDTRTPKTDRGGAICDALLRAAGHRVSSAAVVPDEPAAIRAHLEALAGGDDLDGILLTGGTGVGPRDRTPEAVRPLLEKELPGFGELFRSLSWDEVGSAAYLSRALAGIYRGKAVFVLPGSPAAVRLAVERLILPEIGHLVRLLRRSS